MKVTTFLASSVSAASFVTALPYSNGTGWSLGNFKSLVTFGDSYTDESRLAYFAAHNGAAPPVGTVLPENLKTSTGGRVWARYVVQYAGVNLYDYAVSGAVCSNNITPRFFSEEVGLFPDIEKYEVPAFIADSAYVDPQGEKALDIPVDETVYAIWIGTNDLGNNAFITDSQVRGKTLVDFVDCIYSALDKVYENGGRYFVLMNLAPLQLLPQYATPEAGGLRATQYWKDKPANITEVSYRMLESVVTVNDIYKYKTPYEVKIAQRYPGAHFAIYDTNGLITDIYDHPEQYLNGTAPLDVTSSVNVCDPVTGACTRDPNEDAYIWFDALHPSEQTDRIVAREFVELTKGTSKWATYWS